MTFDQKFSFKDMIFLNLIEPIQLSTPAICRSGFHLAPWKFCSCNVVLDVLDAAVAAQLRQLLEKGAQALGATQLDPVLTFKVIDKSFSRRQNEQFNATIVVHGVYLKNDRACLRAQLINF